VKSAKCKTIAFDEENIKLLQSKGNTPVVLVEMLKQVNISLTFKGKQEARTFFEMLQAVPDT
jgi:hypothetical protein